MTRQVSLQRKIVMLLAGIGSLLAAGTSVATTYTVTPTFSFTNFYADKIYSSVPPDNVDYFVKYNNGPSIQVCAWGPASGSQTTYDCSREGDTGVAIPVSSPPITSVEWWLVNKDDPNPLTREWFHNSLTFTPGPAHAVSSLPSDKFLFGTLTYTNGSWASFGDARVELGYLLTFPTGISVIDGGHPFEYSGGLVVKSTPNLPGGTRDSRADFVYLAEDPGLGSLRAYEPADAIGPGGNTVSAEIWGNLASVHLVDFENVRGGGFLDSGVALALTVPEPPSRELALAGIVMLLGFRYRLRRGLAGAASTTRRI